jgi:hypothetical protein
VEQPAPAAKFTTTDRLFAVLDDPEAADTVARRLVDSGLAADRVTLLRGDGAASWIEAASRGAWGVLSRAIAYMAADQAVDMATYQAALRDGRAVLMLHVTDRAERERAIDCLERAGAHFMNHYGRFATEDISRWRGQPPEVPWHQHR